MKDIFDECELGDLKLKSRIIRIVRIHMEFIKGG